MSVQQREGQWHVLGYRWDLDGVSLSVERLDGEQRGERAFVRLEDLCVFETDGERMCTGWYDTRAGERRSCAQRGVPKRGSQCEECARREGLMVCVMCDGFRCPRNLPERARRYCHQTHHLYLAQFGGGVTKVGTTSNPRKLLRVLEQGPLCAAWIASGFGPTIKQMEHTISNMGYTEFVRRKDKRRWIASAMSEEKAHDLVVEAYRDIEQRLEAPLGEHLGELEIVPRPDIASVDLRGRDIADVDLSQKIHVRGALVAARGHVVVLRDDRGLFSIDLVELKGYPIVWTPTRPPHQRVVQGSLFG